VGGNKNTLRACDSLFYLPNLAVKFDSKISLCRTAFDVRFNKKHVLADLFFPTSQPRNACFRQNSVRSHDHCSNLTDLTKIDPKPIP